MSDRPTDLPEYENPPVIEVILSVQFSELRSYRTVHAGLLWERKFRKAFQNFSEHPTVDPAFETFGPMTAPQTHLTVMQLPGPPLPRLWFINEDKTELIQFQADRFTHNWRKVERNNVYPRYEHIKNSFFKELIELSLFLEEENIGKIEANQCEVTYVNHLVLERNRDIRAHPESALRLWSSVSLDPGEKGGRILRFEDTRFTTRYVIEDDEARALGRLIVVAEPAVGPDEQSLIRFSLTARGAPSNQTVDAVAEFFDAGRDAIVRAFTALTTPAMHKLWKRIR